MISILYYLLTGYINQIYSMNMTAPFSTIPLYDIGFIYLPYISHRICDFLLSLLGFYFITRWIFIDRTKIYNFAKMMSWIFIIRLLCFSSTTVPIPIQYCNARKIGDPIIWNVLPYLANYHAYSCYDLMFSGHAAHSTLIWLYTVIYAGNLYEKILITFGSLICNILIVASRIHYTHDVIVGSAVAILMFGTFFSYDKCPFLQRKSIIYIS